MFDEFEQLEQKVEQLFCTDQQPANLTDCIVDETRFSHKFVSYVLEAIDIHYNEYNLLKHMVKFVAAKLGKDLPFSTHITGSQFNNEISPLVSQLRNDCAFKICSVDQMDQSSSTEFPVLTRIAIIATYCASYNPQGTDRRFFFKGTDVLKRKSKFVSISSRGTVRDSWHESGPRPFDHQRAMFIFLYFCKEFDQQVLDEMIEEDRQIDFTSQVTHLVEAGLLRIVSASENLDLPRYQSLCSLDFVKKIAISICQKFNVEDYLYDFVAE